MSRTATACDPVEAGAWLSSDEVCAVAGVTYRQLDHWARLGYVQASARPACGSGIGRRWTRADADQVARVARGLQEGLTLRAAAARAEMAAVR